MLKPPSNRFKQEEKTGAKDNEKWIKKIQTDDVMRGGRPGLARSNRNRLGPTGTGEDQMEKKEKKERRENYSSTISPNDLINGELYC